MSPSFLLTPEDVQRVARACSRRAPTGIRNRALIVTFYRAGLRTSEALSLSSSQVDCAERKIHVQGLVSRVVSLDDGAAEVIGDWTRLRAELGLNGSPFFCTLRGAPLDQAYVRQFLPKLARKAGVEKPVHALALRDAHVAALLVDGITAGLVQERLGFKTEASAARYMRQIASQL